MTAVIYLCLGIAILYFSGEYLVGGSVSLAKHLKVQPFVIAVTLVAFGTSAPELAISINSALKGLQGITIGNIVGSNIANVLFAIPLAYLIKISKKSDVRKKDSIFLFMITVVFCGLVINMESFDFIYGVISLSILLAYIFFIIYETKIGLRKQNLNNEDEIEFSIIKSSIFSFLGIVGVVVGAEILVHGAVLTAELIGISQVVIGLTVVALGTSLPEVAASMIAAYRGQVNFILGAILGSNLFNILGITGTASILAPIKSAGTLSGIDLSFLMLSSLIFLIFSIFTKFINRVLLVVILISYLIYVLFLFLGF
ncbi:MAG: Inner membrane protein YrbG [Alphaproteobacteria bacterium MarineAlpha9_Bin4]|nr:MAG: Inner membrane protein YrbG [Alphaproteobacteria bacterium MarineAlpha9_Bin4]